MFLWRIRGQEEIVKSTKAALAELQNELDSERARSGERETILASLERHLRELNENSALTSPPTLDTDTVVHPAVKDEILRKLVQLVERPNVKEIERLSLEEMDLLLRKYDTLPEEVRKTGGKRFFETADIDILLADPVWNPNGRQLSFDERLELGASLNHLRFFKKTLAWDRLRTTILPEANRKREEVDYIEYSGPPPRDPRRSKLSHAETTNKPGVFRMYYFQEDQYPEMYHGWHVGREQSVKILVDMYELINGNDS